MDDLIRRQDAIEVINKLMEIHFDRKVVLGKVWQQIKDLPSAQKKGHWLYPTDVKGFCRCEYCGALWGRDLYENKFFKYCPRCGADMRGDDDG